MFIKQRRVLPRAVSIIGAVICAVLMAGFFAVLLVEWMAGCGETYVDAKGQRHQYECVFINFTRSN
jgi:hypothetical protein